MYLFCDIDGVLIPFPGADGSIPVTHHRDQVVPTGYDEPVSIWLNPAHGPMLADLIATTGLEAVWCTSWRADAAHLIGPRLGLLPWPHVDLPHVALTDSHPDGYLWKRDHVIAYAGQQSFAWIDDDFAPIDHEWATARTATGYPILLVQPDPHVGLVAEHVEIIRRWTSSVTLHPRQLCGGSAQLASELGDFVAETGGVLERRPAAASCISSSSCWISRSSSSCGNSLTSGTAGPDPAARRRRPRRSGTAAR